LALRKAGGKSRIPFVPFLSVGLGVVLIAQNGI
jgi:prepilin signal peptidase PulO-like enzyme (type II secretory pathway)